MPIIWRAGWISGSGRGRRRPYGISARRARASRWFRMIQRPAGLSQSDHFLGAEGGQDAADAFAGGPDEVAAMSLWDRLTSMRDSAVSGRVRPWVAASRSSRSEATRPVTSRVVPESRTFSFMRAQPQGERCAAATGRCRAAPAMACCKASPSSRASSVGSTVVTSACRAAARPAGSSRRRNSPDLRMLHDDLVAAGGGRVDLGTARDDDVQGTSGVAPVDDGGMLSGICRRRIRAGQRR